MSGDKTFAGDIKFSELCELYETVQNAKGKLKSSALWKYMQDFKATTSTSSNTNIKQITFYPILRLLVPQLERERSAYGIKETAFSKLYIKTLCLQKGSKEATTLLNYKIQNDAANSRDFAEVVFWILQRRCSSSSSLTVADVNNMLDVIARSYVEHKPRDVDKELSKLIKTATALEQKWIIRIILKDLKLGIGYARILNLFHPDAEDMYNINNSLYMICEKLTDPQIRLHEMDVTIFTPFRPMLSQRCDTGQINRTITNDKTFYVENKFDGERFQLHMKDGIFKYFSKKGYDYSDHFGVSYESGGILTPHLKGCFKSNVKNFILDGEMMGWNKKTRSFGSKGMNYDVKNLKPENTHQPCFCVFDILLCDDKVLSNEKLKNRLRVMETLIVPKIGYIHISERKQIKGKQELLDCLNSAVDKEEEGIVFKDLDSLYKPNERKAGWWKMKLEYFEGVMSDLDVLIIGGYYGEGRRKNKLHSFLMGVAKTPDRSGDNPSEFYSFARIASGLSETEMTHLMQILGDNWIPRDSGDPSKHGVFWGKDKPDVWIPPQKSCIVQVRGSELAHSTDFLTDYSLRFPRIQKIRDDKMWHECMTVTELLELTAGKPVEKLSKRHLELCDIEAAASKKKRKFAGNYHQAEIENVNVQEKSQLLKNFEFRVVKGNATTTTLDIEILIKEHGGTLTQVNRESTYCAIAAEEPKIIDSKNVDVVKLEWLQRCLNDCKMYPLSPKDMYYTCQRTRLKLKTQYDQFGDSYTKRITAEECMDLINNNPKFDEERIYLTNREMDALDKELNSDSNFAVFRNCLLYFDRCTDIFDASTKTFRLLFEELECKMYGGNSTDVLNSCVSHVVMDEKHLNNLQVIKNELKNNNCFNAHIVGAQFVRNSIKNLKIEPVEQYKICSFL